MRERKAYLAIDLGAESGRAILGRLEGGKLETEEVHRFPNEPVRLGETLCWDFPRLFREVVESIRLAGERNEGRLASIGIDSWGVDYGLLDGAGDLLANPVHYRDPRTRGLLDELFEVIPRRDLFRATGIQFLEINTLIQLLALRKRSSELLYVAGKLLMIADLVAYFLSGRAASERTIASTTQMLDPRSGEWSQEVLAPFGIPPQILPEVVEPGSILAPLRPEIVEETALREAPAVVAPASHDTAAAVAAVPATGGGPWAYVSSGTWSLVGMELDAPDLSDAALERNFTNEAGAFGKTRFLKNISGLWLVQECRRQWAREGTELGYQRIAELAEAAPPARAWIDPNAPEFLAPGDMPARIRESCRESGQPEPTTRGDVLRCALESLARAYLDVVRAAEKITDRKIERLHVIGGGSQNELLNRLTANLLGVTVVSGPVEATALGNLLLQAKALGEVEGLDELRAIVEASSELRTYHPKERGAGIPRRDGPAGDAGAGPGGAEPT